MVSKNMTIWLIQNFWWLHIYTKHALLQIFCIVYSLIFSFQISILEPQKLNSNKGEREGTKTCSCVCYVKRCEVDLVLLSSAIFISSSDSELSYPIGIVRLPRIWSNLLSVLDFWSHFVNISRCDFERLISCSRPCNFDSS